MMKLDIHESQTTWIHSQINKRIGNTETIHSKRKEMNFTYSAAPQAIPLFA